MQWRWQNFQLTLNQQREKNQMAQFHSMFEELDYENISFDEFYSIKSSMDLKSSFSNFINNELLPKLTLNKFEDP